MIIFALPGGYFGDKYPRHTVLRVGVILGVFGLGYFLYGIFCKDWRTFCVVKCVAISLGLFGAGKGIQNALLETILRRLRSVGDSVVIIISLNLRYCRYHVFQVL
eukprot:UN12358